MSQSVPVPSEEAEVLARHQLEIIKHGLTGRIADVMYWLERGYRVGEIAQILGVHYTCVSIYKRRLIEGYIRPEIEEE